MTDRPARLLLVDDQSLFMDGMESLLRDAPGIAVAGKAHGGEEAIALVDELRPELVLLDINMPGMDGIETAAVIRKRFPEVAVIVLSMYGHRDFVMELFGLGVNGYLLKSSSRGELLLAFDTVLRGGRHVAREIAPLLKATERDGMGVDERYGSLTKREVEIVKLIIKERTTQEIADELFLSYSTVETHRKNILHKLEVRNVAGLVKYALDRGWGA